jgi:membrane AbrB-like protein
MKNASKLLAIGLIGGLIAISLHIPAGFMIGAMVAVGVSRLVFLNLGTAPRIYGEIGKILVGTFIGATFDRHVLAQLGSLLLPTAVAMLVLIAIGLALGWVLTKLTDLDVPTALFSLTPGGLPEMTAVAQEVGADSRVVVTLQFLRLASVVILVPLLLRLVFS